MDEPLTIKRMADDLEWILSQKTTEGDHLLRIWKNWHRPELGQVWPALKPSHAIYFLMQIGETPGENDGVQYIGRSINLPRRLVDHRRDPFVWHYAYYVDCHGFAYRAEAHLLWKYDPPFNYSGTPKHSAAAKEQATCRWHQKRLQAV